MQIDGLMNSSGKQILIIKGSMGELTLDDTIQSIGGELLQLPSPKIATFAASCSERFIGFYEEFAAKANWKPFALIREALNAVWSFLCGDVASREDLLKALYTVEELTPHSDDFDIDEAIFAQDACICIRDAILWCLGRSDAAFAVVEFSFEALRFGRCIANTGYIQLGSTVEGAEFEKLLMHDSIVCTEYELQRKDLELLQTVELSPDVVNSMRLRAEQNRWSVEKVLKPADNSSADY